MQIIILTSVAILTIINTFATFGAIGALLLIIGTLGIGLVIRFIGNA